MLVPVPPGLRERAEAVGADPAVPRDAATIAVVRDGERGLEAFLMRRQASMAFAAGMYVFPGGSVDPADAEGIDWVGPEASWWAGRFGCSEAVAAALVVAAVRETFEETGVLLAGPDETEVHGDTTMLDPERAALERGELSFAAFLGQRGLVLRADLLGPWAHWITPAFEPRRYDTRFFVAVLPEGQRIGTVSDEADTSLWAPLSSVLEAVDAKRAAMLPPTAVTCRELAGLTADTVLATAAERSITPIEPRLVQVDGQWWLETQAEGHV